MQLMRTTITLDAESEALIKRDMRERGVSFKQAINDAIRAGLAPARQAPSTSTPTFRMGFNPPIPWDKALRLAAEMEAEELARKHATPN
jgi:hypothetical protein